MAKKEIIRLGQTFQSIWIVSWGLRVLVRILEDAFVLNEVLIKGSLFIAVVGIGFGLAGLIIRFSFKE